MKLITYENLRNFAYSNDKICKKPIRGIAISFFGLGKTEMYSENTDMGMYFAEKGIVFVVPYTNPWAWMNPQATSFTDEIINCLIDRYNLPQDLPIVSTGRSMGGQSALTYMVYAEHTPVACVANCPVCDMPYHYTERPDLPRTMYSAFFHEDGEMEEILKRFSPTHLIDKMPDADYYIFHCEKDMKVNKERHSDLFCEKMKKEHRITYHAVPERGHCDLTEDMVELFNEYIVKSVRDVKE